MKGEPKEEKGPENGAEKEEGIADPEKDKEDEEEDEVATADEEAGTGIMDAEVDLQP